MGKFREMYEKEGVKYSYSSLQVDMPLHIARVVMNYSYLIPANLLYNPTDEKKYGVENEIHCTILYGIHSPDSEGVRDIIERFRICPFSLKFGAVSFFEQDEYDVMKYEIISPYLHEINRMMVEGLDYTNTYNNYQPHCTIAYLKKGVKEQHVFDFDSYVLVDREVWIDELTFSSKTGQTELISLNGQIGGFRHFIERKET